MSKLSRVGITAVVLIAAATLAAGQAKTAASEKPAAKASAAKAPAKGPVVWNTDQAKWIDSTDMPGLHEAVVTGDPDKGASVVYLKFDSGVAIQWHWHPGAEIVYGDSGTTEVHMLHSDQVAKITSGSYAKLPAHMIHSAKCISKDPCMLYLESAVPLVTHMVDENGKEIPSKTAPAAKPAKKS